MDTDLEVPEESSRKKEKMQNRRALRNSIDSVKSGNMQIGTISLSHLEWSKMQSGFSPKNQGKIQNEIVTRDSSSRSVTRRSSVNGGGSGSGTNESSHSPSNLEVEKKVRSRRATYDV